MRAQFLHTATPFLLGFNALSQDREKEDMYGDLTTFTTAFQDSMFWCGMRIILGRLRFLLPRWKIEKAFKSSHDFLDFHIEEAFARKENQEIETKSSLIEELVRQTDDKTEVRNQSLQILMASSDTISKLLSNAMFLLSRYPDVWAQLRKEVLGDGMEEVTIEGLSRRGLVRNVLLEGFSFLSLR